MTREEAINKVREMSLPKETKEILEVLAPELAESEDERIRKELIEFIKWSVDRHFMREDFHQAKRPSEWIAYLEKQGEQKVSVDDFKAKDWYVSKVDGKIHNIYYSVDKVKPKFKVGDKIIEKDFDKCGRGTIIDIKDGKYIFDDGGFICIEEQGLWKLVEQKPAWSEEDERIKARLIEYFQGFLEGYEDCYKDGGCVKWEGLDVKSILAWLEKQKEQKHPNGCFTCDEYKKGYEEGRRNGFTAGYNKAMKEVEQKEQKPVVTLGETYHVDTLGTQQVIAGKMPQKPAEWGEEDERKLQHCIDIVGVWEGDYDIAYAPYSNFLKSLRPSWKPSEAQLMALHSMIDDESDTIGNEQLKLLYNDLKKL